VAAPAPTAGGSTPAATTAGATAAAQATGAADDLSAQEPAAPAALVTVALSRTDAQASEHAARGVAGEPAGTPARTEAPVAPAGPPALPAPQASSTGVSHAAGASVLARATNAAELAHELGARMRMAVREGGRELVVNMRPAELGHLTVRVTMVDGVLTAQIAADRPEAAKLLQQSLPQLGAVLQDLGYSVDGLDVSYAGQQGHPGHDASDAANERSAAGGTGGADGEAAATGDPGAVAAAPSSSGAADGDHLDLLA
jgi:flagellar hook-length control protein FliK